MTLPDDDSRSAVPHPDAAVAAPRDAVLSAPPADAAVAAPRDAVLSAPPADAAVAAPRDAGTVVLCRDGDTGLEVYLLRRVPTMSFAAGMHVFPGGSVDPRDADVPWRGPAPQIWSGQLSADETLTRQLAAAAVRETFEEAGVLLATGPQPLELSHPSWETDRLALLDGSLAFADLLARRNVRLDADLLAPWAHWITPTDLPRRFDTRFFVAALPAGQQTRDVGGEADAVLWARPADVLSRYRPTLMPPTASVLTELTGHAGVADVLQSARIRRIVTVLPRSSKHL